MEKLPNLPIGQQYFKSVRTGNGVYVDKTKYIYELCQPIDRAYFLSRPRRFFRGVILYRCYKPLLANPHSLTGGYNDKTAAFHHFDIYHFGPDGLCIQPGLCRLC